MAFDNGRSLTAEEIYEQILKGNITGDGGSDVNECEENIELIDQLYEFEFNDDHYELIECKDKSIQNANIPKQYKGYPVTYIGNSAFEKCEELVEVVIPNSVTIIDYWAFQGCSSLTSVLIPNSVTTIDELAFADCTSLTSVHIPASVTNIVDSIFNTCSSLTNITVDENNPKYKSIDGNLYSVEDGVTTLVEYAIGKRDESFTIPDSVTIIGPRAFVNSPYLKNVKISNSVKYIGESAFWGCSSLEYMDIPESVISIGGSAFENCMNLFRVRIAASITDIESSMFSNCSSLASVTIPNSVTSIGNWAFCDCSSLTIYCEATSKPAGWSPNWNSSKRPVVWGCKSEE